MSGSRKNVKSQADLPRSMNAAAIDRYGSAMELKPCVLPIPQPQPNQVLIANYAAGVGVWDIQIRDGSWQPRGHVTPPIILGTDSAGIMAKLGSNVTEFEVGERVYAYGDGDFYAAYTAVDVDRVGRIPEHMNFLEAAAVVVPGLTDLQGLEDILKLKAGETLLVFGASGSMGTLAIQFAKARGVRVIATASGEDSQKLVLRLGADIVLDARRDDAAQQLRRLAPNGIEAAFVLAGGTTLENCLESVQPGGRIAFPYGAEPAPRSRPRISVTGYNLVAGRKEMDRLTRLSIEAKLHVPVASVYPLEKAAEAHLRLEEGRVPGRIVLRTKLTTTD